MRERSPTWNRGFADLKRLCYAGLDAETLLQRASDALRHTVGFDLSCMHTNDPASGLITRAFYSEPGHDDVSSAALERVYFVDEVTPFGWMAKRNLPAVSLSQATGGVRERALRYREIMAPLGVEYEARGVCALDGELWGSFSIMREAAGRDFGDDELRLLREIAPHLAAGLKAAALRSEASAEPDGVDAPGVLMLDGVRRVVQYTAAAERALRDVEELGPRWRDGVGLPAAVSTMLGLLRHTFAAGNGGSQREIPRLLIQGRSGRWLTIHGAWTEPGSGHGGETVIVIEPAGPRQLAWLKTMAYGLTVREQEVVDLVMRGSSTRQISRTLHISEYTVQEHLTNVFDKVGVRGRRALVKRLYLESILSPESHPAATLLPD